MKAQKKPIVIDYLPYTEDVNEIMDWVKSLGGNFEDHFKVFFDDDICLFVKTLEGTSYEVTTITLVKKQYFMKLITF